MEISDFLISFGAGTATAAAIVLIWLYARYRKQTPRIFPMFALAMLGALVVHSLVGRDGKAEPLDLIESNKDRYLKTVMHAGPPPGPEYYAVIGKDKAGKLTYSWRKP